MSRFTRRTWIIGLAALSLAALTAVSASAPAVGPSRILLGWAGDPATSCAATWRTAEAVTEPRAQVAVAPAGPLIADVAVTVAARSSRVTLASGAVVYHHRATFDHLAPATRHVYRVGDGRTWSEWFEFTTASPGPAPFRFIYLGDAQNGLNDTWPRTVRAAYARAPDARLITFAGDLVAEGYDDGLWEQWANGLGFVAASVPILPVPGNHDEHRAPGTPEAGKVMDVAPVWRAQFATPDNGPALPGLEGQNYWLDYQGVRFIAVDVNPFANEDYVESERDRVRTAVVAWLEGLVAHNPNRWTIVVQHQPLFPVAKDRDYPALRSMLGALYDRYHVDLVLQGHDHAYSRTHKVRGGQAVGPAEPGTVYVISVCGSKMYETTDRYAGIMARLLTRMQLYQIISVDGDRLGFDSYSDDGRRIDAFELVKTAGGSVLREIGEAR